MADFPVFTAQGVGSDLDAAAQKPPQAEIGLPGQIDDILTWLEDMYPSMQVCSPTGCQRRAVWRAPIRQAAALGRSLATREMQRVLAGVSFDL